MVLIHQLKHKGETYTIEEPIGFDDLQTKITRGDYHGISLEVSVGNLEFYGKAYNIIKEAYYSDIDSQILYEVSFSDGRILYSGTIDLSTYSEKCGDYCSITCKVGDIGAKTTFNNRTDTEVDLNTTKTIDGADLGMQASWEHLNIPLKHLKYTNSAKQATEEEYAVAHDYTAGYTTDTTPFVLNKVKVNEFGEVCEGSVLFAETGDFDEEFGSGTTMAVDLRIKARITENQTISTGGIFRWYIALKSGENTIAVSQFMNRRVGDTAEIVYQGNVSTDQPLRLFFREYHQYDLQSWNVKIAIEKDSYMKLTMFDNIEDSNVDADMLVVHNALNVVAGSISENELSVKSDWYGGLLSSWNKPTQTGGGHLKAITNGYKIRGLFTDGENERNMPISFKDLITSLSALDCIGWGFSNENGQDFVRVERWDWFYKDAVILALDGTNESSRSFDTGRIKTDLQIGFKKYETDSTFNSIDSIHGERSFANAIKVLSSKASQLCSLIADTYSIEETRRAKDKVDPSESFKYDENIFVFELDAEGSNIAGAQSRIISIPNNVNSSSGIDRPAEQYNVQLSPRRCAERWRSFLFSSSNRSAYRFISGKINYKPAFECKQSQSTASYYHYYLADFYGGQKLAEDADIDYAHTKFKAEKLHFSYPITIDQYKAIIANPYGLISIDGIKGWIQEMQYKFATGEAEFTLIPKFE